MHLNFCGPSSIFHLRTLTAHRAPTLTTLYALPESEPSKAVSSKGCSLPRTGWCAFTGRDRTIAGVVPAIRSKSSVIINTLNLPEVEVRPLPFEKPQLLCLGRIVPDKGFDLVVEALASIVRVVPEVRLTIAGDGIDSHDSSSKPAD